MFAVEKMKHIHGDDPLVAIVSYKEKKEEGKRERDGERRKESELRSLSFVRKTIKRALHTLTPVAVGVLLCTIY